MQRLLIVPLIFCTIAVTACSTAKAPAVPGQVGQASMASTVNFTVIGNESNTDNPNTVSP